MKMKLVYIQVINILTVWRRNIAPNFQMKKACFLTVNVYEILHASTYGIYEYKAKKTCRG